MKNRCFYVSQKRNDSITSNGLKKFNLGSSSPFSADKVNILNFKDSYASSVKGGSASSSPVIRARVEESDSKIMELKLMNSVNSSTTRTPSMMNHINLFDFCSQVVYNFSREPGRSEEAPYQIKVKLLWWIYW